ncbi:acyl-CoA synthetase family member 2, mitochondrial-like [Pocillopora damicornis]|uniref:acyl-CoA synthetase family member 2, mitochondrial-like n=1 Tax=Pocillopora damicornis TaxID=46731 RepID=UPI000F552738|nr:acyl-CoA synthetase family member 2, mitochondrial-like [Pocillopora damicornis]
MAAISARGPSILNSAAKCGNLRFRFQWIERFSKPVSFGFCKSVRCSSTSSHEKLQFSYCHAISSKRFIGETIGQRLDMTVEKFPDREAYVCSEDNERATFAEFQGEVNSLAAGLLAMGFKKGDRVGMWGPNMREWVITQFATAKAGLILVNINPAYQTPELEYALKKVGCKAIIMADRFKTQDYYSMLTHIVHELPQSKPGDLFNERVPDLKLVVMASKDHQRTFSGTMSFQELMEIGGTEERKKLEELKNELQCDDPINIQFTSGTTGNPKGATLSHHNILNNAYYVGEILDYENQYSRICIPVPLYHCFGMVLGRICYGLTETSPVTTQTLMDDPIDLRVSTIGHVHPNNEAKIVDSDDRVVPVNTAGEICFRGYNVMLGYWDDKEKTDACIDPSGWFHSGDLATMDENGFIKIIGRIKDLIIRGGENIYPTEVEQFLYTHPKIQDVQVIGVPDPRLGEEVCAWIKLHAGETATPEEIKEFCKGEISHFKIPRYIKFIDEFPLTVTGKVKKFVMREKTKEELNL